MAIAIERAFWFDLSFRVHLTLSLNRTDVQPSTSPNAICIFVTGAVTLGSPNPIHFCEFIQLVSAGDNNFTIHNCIFRLNYGL